VRALADKVRAAVVGHPLATDAAIAGLLAAFVLQDVVGSTNYLTASKAIYVPAALLMTIPLAWRRRAPFAVAIVVMVTAAVQSIAVGSAPTPDSALPAWLLAIYTMAAGCERRAALVGLAVSMAAGAIWLGIDDFLLPLVVFGGAWLAGRFARQTRVYAQMAEERAAALERAREADARAVAADERARIARELHDVVGHRVSVMVVQAGAERLALDSPRANTKATLQAIETTGRQVLAEMRHLLGVLRAADDDVKRRPLPTLGDLAELLDDVRAAGAAVELRIEGEPFVVPDGVGLSAYRIVQEALTNVLKHARPARAEVVIGYEPDGIQVRVADDGRGAAQLNGSGHGLVGMRERVALYGGDFSASAGPAGGFVVCARFPLEGSAQ
jgi:signal transduction histidine kinase